MLLKPSKHTNLINIDIGQRDQANGINAKSDVDHGSQTDDIFARHHQSQNTAAHCSSYTDQNRSSIDTPEIKNTIVQSFLSIVTDQQLPKIKNASIDSVNNTSHKTNGVANFKPVKSFNKPKKMQHNKIGVFKLPQTKAQQRKRKNANATIVGNMAKRQKLNEQNLTARTRAHTVKQPYQCQICKTRFTRQCNLNTHMKKHGGMFAYQCSICRRGFESISLGKAHEICCKAKQYECYLCNRKFYQRKSDLFRHMQRWHTGEKPFNCLESHSIVWNDTSRANVESIVGESQPMVQQRKTKNLNRRTGSLKKKRKLNDTLDIAKRFKCDFCEFSTKWKWILARHTHIHTDERPYQCELCETRFNQQYNLHTHMKTHGEMFPFQCSICRLGFTQKNPWKLHESCCKAKQYECFLCNCKFYQRKNNLQMHMQRWHTGEKPFSCSECPQRYFIKKDLTRHMKYHKWLSTKAIK